MVQIELGKAYIPESVLREIERAIQAAEFPRGMSVHDGKAKVDSSHLRRLLAELAALRAELESAHAAQRHAETELSQYMAWYAMAEHQHLHEQRLREKAEAERDALRAAVEAAPHSPGCGSQVCTSWTCNCWKRAALGENQ